MGAHSDDERELLRHLPVVSLSWATPAHYRRFRFTPRKGVSDALAPEWGAGPGVLRLHNGCLVVMGGLCQTTHKHELMKPTKQLAESSGRRINLTLRAFDAKSALASKKRQREEVAAPAPAPSVAAPAPSEAASSAAASSSGIGAWACRACTYMHEGGEAEYLACRMCGAERSSEVGTSFA